MNTKQFIKRYMREIITILIIIVSALIFFPLMITSISNKSESCQEVIEISLKQLSV
jgi:hypothetical protein